jgi:hypothetical protein
MRPLPLMMHQISSTVRCATALDTAPGGRVNRAMLPRDVAQSSRTSEPSRANASGTAAARLVANRCMRGRPGA